jgi:hypothetical protein
MKAKLNMLGTHWWVANKMETSALAARISKGNQAVGDGNGKVYPFG